MNGIPFPECELEKTSTSPQITKPATPYESNQFAVSENCVKESVLKPMRIILFEDYQKGRLMRY